MSSPSGRTLGQRDPEALFRLAVEASPNGMLMADESGRIVLANREAERMFGYPRGELVGRGIEDLVPPSVRGRHAKLREGFAERPETRSMGAGRDLHGLRKDGVEFPVEIGLNPIRSDEGLFVLASVIDITERRRLQKELFLKEGLAEVGTLAATMAHEIRNPLGSIVTAARSIARGGLSPEDIETLVSVLRSESARLNKTLGDLLQFARPREPALRDESLNPVVEEIAAAVRGDEAAIGGVRLLTRLDPGLPAAPHDPDQLRQVVWNLVRNALEALEGKGTLTIETSAAGDEVRLRVADDGPGIPPAELDRILHPFHTTKKSGTGLGLAIVHRIVRAHRGRLVVQSRPGEGASFSVLLPRARS